MSACAGEPVEVYHEDFESGPGGFTTDNTGGTFLGLWHLSVGRREDELPSHSPDHSFYYGAFETSTGGGRYNVLPGDHQGVLISPEILLPPTGTTTMMFNYVLDTRPDLNVDFVNVSVDDGASITTILSRQDGSLPETGGVWLSAMADLSQFNGQAIQLRFSFDTGEPPPFDPEGWYVDDVWISNIPPPEIAGYKWDDQDADGAWDETEPGLNGWTIYLDLNNNNQRDGDEPSFVTQNDGEHDGAFCFRIDLDPGTTVTVREELPEGWKQSFPGMGPEFEHIVASNETPLAGRFGVAESPNFGNFQPDISGYKWHDQDADGTWDPGEPGLNGWTIYLDQNDNNILDAGEQSFLTKNDGMHDGAFWFLVAPGSHTLREILPEGWKQSFPGMGGDFEHDVTVSQQTPVVGSFGEAEAPNFGNFQADISGYKWDDQDADGVWDANEPGLNGWIIYLDENGNHVLDAGEESFTSKNDGMHDGAFWFLVPPGTYAVREILPEGWKQSFPGMADDFEHEATVSEEMPVGGSFGAAEAPNFGNFQPDISGYKWDDQDADGVWDAGEPGLNGWTIYLDANGNNVLDPGEASFITKHDGMHDGAFWFLVDPGTYTVREVLPDGWKQSFPGMDLDFEHDVTVGDGMPIVGSFGQAEPPNFGDFQPAIAGYKWHDQDGDGLWDAGEPGLNGWIIYLDENDNDVLDVGELSFTTQNDSTHDGAFWFLVDPGTYTVREVVPDNWEQTFLGGPGFEHEVTVDPPDGERVNGLFEATEPPNFGNRMITGVAGSKFADLDLDGMRDAGEPGVANWVIRAYADVNSNGLLDAADVANGVVAFDTSDSDGNYRILLDPGDYIVVELLQPGSLQTAPTTLVNTVDSSLGAMGYAVTVSSALVLDLDFGNLAAENIEQEAANEVGTVHLFQVRISVPGTLDPVVGACVTATLTNANGASADFVPDGNDCDGDGLQGNDALTDATGRAIIGITSPTAGLTTAAFAVDAAVGPVNIDADGVKVWVDAVIQLSPLAGSAGIGATQSVTATVLQNDGLLAGQSVGGLVGDAFNGFGPAPNGTLVTFSLLNNTAGATFVSGSTCTTVNGSCGVGVVANNSGSTDVHAATSFTVLGLVPLTRETDGAQTAPGSGNFNSDDAALGWVSGSKRRFLASTFNDPEGLPPSSETEGQQPGPSGSPVSAELGEPMRSSSAGSNLASDDSSTDALADRPFVRRFVRRFLASAVVDPLDPPAQAPSGVRAALTPLEGETKEASAVPAAHLPAADEPRPTANPSGAVQAPNPSVGDVVAIVGLDVPTGAGDRAASQASAVDAVPLVLAVPGLPPVTVPGAENEKSDSIGLTAHELVDQVFATADL